MVSSGWGKALLLVALMTALLSVEEDDATAAAALKAKANTNIMSWLPMPAAAAPIPNPPAASAAMDSIKTWMGRVSLAVAGTVVPLMVSEYLDGLHAGHRCSSKAKVARCVHDRTKMSRVY